MPVNEEEAGQSLEYRKPRKYPKYQKIWNTSYSNKLGRSCKWVRKGIYGPRNQHVRGTDTFKVIHYTDIPVDRRKEITYKKVVYEVHPHKEDPNFTRTNIGGNCIYYPGKVGTPTGSLELIKLIINSVVS